MPNPSNRLEALTVFHVALLAVIAAWAFGGGSVPATRFLCCAGSFAPVVTVAAILKRQQEGRPWLRAIAPLLPLLGINLLVLLGVLHPSLRSVTVEGIEGLVPVQTSPYLPDSARPDLAVPELWLIDASILSAFNLLLAVESRKILRMLLLILSGNALILAVFGSIQKFVSAGGPFFGQVRSPNPTFFASFIYRNHWGAFVLLALGMALALLFETPRRPEHRDFWHSPAIAAVVGVFFLAATLPLCGSRSCTVLAILLLASALSHGMIRVIRHRRNQHQSAAAPVTFVALAATAALAVVATLAKPVIETRLADTENQIKQMQSWGHIGSRGQLYRDTWRMALDKPWYGWGLGSYGTIFQSYNTQTSVDGLPQYYEHAHSDWLQFLAETGVVGAGLGLIFCLLVFLPALDRKGIPAGPAYLLSGCALIALYAWIEFPFGNPAVSLIFWICLFGSLRWIRLNRTNPVP